MKNTNLINKNNLINGYESNANEVAKINYDNTIESRKDIDSVWSWRNERENGVYKHIKAISNLRIFNWAHKTNLYNFKNVLYNINNSTRINNVSLIAATEFITNLFKRIGILISKIKYSKIASTIELQFGYWTPRKFKAFKKVWSKKTNKWIVVKKWNTALDPIAHINKPTYFEKIAPQYAAYNIELPDRDIISRINYNKFKIATAIIANFLKSNVRLNTYKLYDRWQDTSILLESISYFALKRNLRKIIWKFFLKSKSYARPLDNFKAPVSTGYLTGIFIKVAGRSYRIKLTNRRLVVKTEKGRYARKSALLADKARVNKINKYGTFAITITTGSTL